MFQKHQRRLAGNEFQAFRNALMRLLVLMAPMPSMETFFIFPKGEQPNLVRIVTWTEDLKPKEPRRAIDLMGPVFERLPHFSNHPVGDGEAAQRDK